MIINFKSESLVVDWISFNIQGLPDPGTIAYGLSKHFTLHVLIDGEPKMLYYGFKKKYKVSIRQYTESKGHWVGTQIIFSGKNAAHCYNLIKTTKIILRIINLIFFTFNHIIQFEGSRLKFNITLLNLN